MTSDNLCIGIDFGTDSVRTIIVDAANGVELTSSVFHYPRWKDGLYCNASLNQFRQHPSDYIEGMESTIRDCLQKAGDTARGKIKAISVDTTGSTPVAADKEGLPLSLHPAFAEDPDAMFVLWKDHSALTETVEINAHAKKFNIDYLKYVGGIYSSEWYWAKLLHILRKNEKVRTHCFSFVEHSDWIPFLLTGGRDSSAMKRNVCTAGHKGLWSEEWDGFPPDTFFSSLDPLLSGYASRLPRVTHTADKIAGTLSGSWASRLGLNPEVVVGIGAMDAHMGAVGGQIEPYYMSKVMGTSTCDMVIAPVAKMQGKFVQGICGLVNGSIIPGMIGMEAGQSGFGDIYAWVRDLLAWPLKHIITDMNGRKEVVEKIIPELSRYAALLPLEEKAELSIDWFNGRRTPDANAALKGAITELNLATDAPRLFRSLVESTCFGARAIADRFIQQGVPLKGLIGVGGVARKSPYVMQMMSDVMGMSIKINRSEQTCALGAAMFAATAGGIYSKVEDAMNAMGQDFDTVYHPDKTKSFIYERRYADYLKTGRFIEQHHNQLPGIPL